MNIEAEASEVVCFFRRGFAVEDIAQWTGVPVETLAAWRANWQARKSLGKGVRWTVMKWCPTPDEIAERMAPIREAKRAAGGGAADYEKMETAFLRVLRRR